jgi:hypothetical protein
MARETMSGSAPKSWTMSGASASQVVSSGSVPGLP